MGKSILITSGKGGSGKSSLSAGLAMCLARQGKSVLLIDLDSGLRCQDLLLGLSQNIVFDLSDVLSGTATLQSASVASPLFGGVSLLSAPLEVADIDGAKLRELTQQAAEKNDFILLDCPAGFDGGFAAGAAAADCAIVVVTPDPVGIRDANNTRRALAPFRLHSGLVINKFDRKLIGTKYCPDIDDIVDQTGIRLLGIVPVDENIPRMGALGQPLNSGKALPAIERISKRISNIEVPLPPIGRI